MEPDDGPRDRGAGCPIGNPSFNRRADVRPDDTARHGVARGRRDRRPLEDREDEGRGAAIDRDRYDVLPIAITKAGPANATAGANFTYTITIANLGPSAATDVVATDVLPAGVTFVSATGGGTPNGNVVTWPVISLTASEQVTFSVTVSAAEGGTVVNTASVSSPSDPIWNLQYSEEEIRAIVDRGEEG